MKLNERVFRLLESNNYVVRAKISKLDCEVSYPEYLNGRHLPAKTVNYKLSKKNGIVKTSDGQSIKIPVPTYSMRMVLWADVINYCDAIDYSTKLIAVYNDKDILEIGDDRLLYNLPLVDKDDDVNETNFLMLIRDAIRNDFDDLYSDVASTMGMDVPYEIIRSLLQKG